MDQLDFELVPDFAAEWSLLAKPTTPLWLLPDTLLGAVSLSCCAHSKASQGLDPAGSVACLSRNGAQAWSATPRGKKVTVGDVTSPPISQAILFKTLFRCDRRLLGAPMPTGVYPSESPALSPAPAGCMHAVTGGLLNPLCS